jgi:hypothetical protein
MVWIGVCVKDGETLSLDQHVAWTSTLPAQLERL